MGNQYAFFVTHTTSKLSIMNGTKWYKLNKSNEPLEIFLEEHFSKLQESVGDKIFSGVINVGEIIFSAGLTFYLELVEASPQQIVKSFLPTEWIAKLETFPLYNAELCSFISITISCVISFIFALGIAKGIVFLSKLVFLRRRKTPMEAYKKEEYFYKKIMNDIITGISLEKKAFELNSGIDKSVTQQQDLDLYIIYLMESVFYFHEAIVNIENKDFVQINNPEEMDYTFFLYSITPDIVCNTFQACVSTLDRIVHGLEKRGRDTTSALDAKKTYEMYIKAIKKQLA